MGKQEIGIQEFITVCLHHNHTSASYELRDINQNCYQIVMPPA